jgi:O-antigen/teichoic acid export membrane protein
MALLSLAFFPLYIRYLGVEAYGLIGAFTAIQSFSAVLDAGFGTTLNRELARMSTDAIQAKSMRDLVRTLEVVYWTLAIIVAMGLTLLAPLAAQHWVHPERLSNGQVARALMLMGINFALVWPSTIYQGGLNGLQHHVPANLVTGVVGGIRVTGAVAVLVLISPTLEAFFVWQIAANGVSTALLGVLLWRALPAAAGKAQVTVDQLRATRRFAAGVIGITVLALLLQQTDKVLLSKTLTLTSLGYYTFAAAVAASLLRVVGPINTTFFPRFAELVRLDDAAELAVVYHRACQLVSVAVLPVAVVLAIFAGDVLTLWTRSPDLVAHTRLLVTVLVIGNAVFSLMFMPYALQLAHGWTRLAFVSNLLAVIVLVPGMLAVTRRWDALGAAVVWTLVMSAYVAGQISVMHRRLLRGEFRTWCIDDVAKPLAACCATAFTGWWLVSGAHRAIVQLLMLSIIFLLSAAAAVLTVSWLRALGAALVQRTYRRIATPSFRTVKHQPGSES